jgi:zinc/manganese transport system substrate-binding protein
LRSDRQAPRNDRQALRSDRQIVLLDGPRPPSRRERVSPYQPLPTANYLAPLRKLLAFSRRDFYRFSMKVFRFALLVWACSMGALFGAEKIRVSTFSTILTEVAQQVGGDRVEVTGHLKPGVDPHDFEPKPSDLKAVANAQLVLLSAKHMEGYMGKLQEATGTKGALVEVGNRGMKSLKLTVQHGDHAHDGEDPHWWHSVRNVAQAAKVVRDELTRISPADKAVFAANAKAYLARLEALEGWVETKVAELPRNQRKLVTNHDAFGYFAKDFGFTVMPIAGLSKNDQPGSKKVAQLVAQIKAAGVKAVFSEDVANPKVIQEITRESGAKFGGELLSDGLGTGAKATVEGMFKHNVTTIVEALK